MQLFVNSLDPKKDNVEKNYELGRLIGTYFDENAYEQNPLIGFECYYKDSKEGFYWTDKCIFEKRENSILWNYYQVFSKVINQLRVYNTEVQEILYDTTAWVQMSASFMSADKDMEGFQQMLGKICDLSEAKNWEQRFNHCVAVDDIWFKNMIRTQYIIWCVEALDNTVKNYYFATGNLIYDLIPRMFRFIDKGEVALEQDHFGVINNRQRTFCEEYNKVLETLRELMQ